MREYRPENPGNQGGRGWKKRLRVDMQAGTVRLEESRAINGVQHPLHRQSLRSLPAHPRVRSSWAPSSPRGPRYTKVLSAADVVQIASTPHAIVFSKAGKTILDPSMRTVHSPPELNQWSPIPGSKGPYGLLDRLTCRCTRREGRL